MRTRPIATSLSILLAAGVVAGVWTPAPAGAGGGPSTSLASRATGVGGVKGNGNSLAPAVSADGRYVAFESLATNLDPADPDTANDVFLRDRRTGVTTLVSRATGAAGAKGNAASVSPAISADGKRVAFVSAATNLDPADADGVLDVFVRDVVAGTTTLVSRATGLAGAKANGNSLGTAISADGRVVAFTANANNVDLADADLNTDLFVRDVVAGTTVLASRASGAAGAKGNAQSISMAMSADGRRVSWATPASNLDPADVDGFNDIYVRDVVANTTVLASRASGGAGVKGNANTAGRTGLSADGHMVVFDSSASNLDPADPDGNSDVFVRDLTSNTTALVSRATGVAGAKGSGANFNAAISGDGRSVAFASLSTNLDTGDPDGTTDVYVRDLIAATTWLASRSTGGVKGNAASTAPSLSGDGRYVAFSSFATTLDPADTDGINDVFVHTIDLPAVTAVDPPTLRRGFTKVVAVIGTGFTATPDVFFGAGVTTGPVIFRSSTRLEVAVAVSPDAVLGNRLVTVVNPAGDSALGTFTVVPEAGYWLVARDGGVFSFDALFSGSTGATRLNQPIVGMAADPDGKGYWFVAADGGVFAFDATFHGSMGGQRLNQPIVGMAATTTGKGYFLVARDGGIFAFGDAVFAGSTGAIRLNQPIVGMTADPDGKGYWFVAADGGVFAFDAVFSGSMGAQRLNRPVVGMAADPDGKGYWLVASDGGVFSFDALFSGSTGAIRLNQPIVGMTADPDGKGYWFVAADGGVFAFDAVFHGSTGAIRLNQPIVGMAPA